MGLVLASGFFGLSTTISTLLVSNLCGPFALIFAGTLGHMFCTVAGFFFFDDAKATQNMIIGLIVSFMGSIYFVYNEYYKVWPK